MKRHLRSLLGISVAMTLTGCSIWPIWSGDSEPVEPTLASLKPARLPDAGQPLPQVGLPQVAENYRTVLSGTDDAQLRAQVTQRLADLQMLSGEQNQLAGGAPGAQYFGATIAAYRELLRQYPDNPDNDRLLYQLSKAYDLDGRGDESLAVLQQFVAKYPQSPYYAEAQFRRGELLFARADYIHAEAAYAEVVKAGSESTYYRNALYMQGWAQFKRAGYDAALQSFTSTLDLLWPRGRTLDRIDGAQRELVGDTLRVMSLIFSYENGAQSIKDTYARLGERHYDAELYRQLGQLYLQQKRYRDAAETYRAYADSHPLDGAAPAMYVLLIGAFEEGNFPSEVLAEKGEFCRRYGIRSDYWKQADAAQREPVRAQLQNYLAELAQHHHALAQRTRASLGKPAAAGAEPVSDADKKAAAQQSYRQAGNYYQEYIDTFSNPEAEADGVPADPQVVRMVFLLAESRFEAEDFAAAVEAYEQAAYRYAGSDAARGADAGYSALLAYEELIRRTPDDRQETLRQAKIASELRFAQRYSGDKRAVAVQARAADELFAAKDYGAAIAAATVVLQWQPAAEPRLHRSAALIVGHGEFEQQHYAQAEQGYRTALGFMAASDGERAAVQERLAAAVYKQGEQRLAAGDRQAAAQEFLRVAEVAPDSSIRVNAQYDAATQFMEGGEWQSAIATLGDLRKKFPQHDLSAGVAAKLAVAYQESGQTAAAAAELVRVAKQDPDASTRREALWTAAELYQKAGANTEASAAYRDYVQQYPQPFAQALEARHQLSVLAPAGEQRRQWLQQIVDADATAGSMRSDRSRFLAAQSQDELADAQYQAFISMRLTLPLKDSLKNKKVALEQVLRAYARSGDYGIAQFSTKATFRIGEIYAALARDLLQSERPPGLTDLEKEQYQILLEEQADPFVEKAIAVHEGNARRARENIFDEWVDRSYAALAQLQPARYRRPEAATTASDEIR
jgi:outer membrane protein assembly factor BamD (BamD/ComL family)